MPTHDTHHDNPRDTQLSPHFWLSEFTASRTAAVLGIANTPNDHHVGNLRRLAHALEGVRTLLGGHPITILSGYRSAGLNVQVGGSRTSAHLHGLAADFICPAHGSPLQTCRRIATSRIAFDQVIHEGTWVHFAMPSRFADSMPRRQVLTAHFSPAGATYTEGLPS